MTLRLMEFILEEDKKYICLKTVKFEYYNKGFFFYFIFRVPLAPEEGPSAVECSATSSTSLRVSWQPIPLHKQAGALIGYTILFAATGERCMRSSIVTRKKSRTSQFSLL